MTLKAWSLQFISLIMILSLSCKPQTSGIPEIEAKQLSDYWFQGKAEISTFALQQARYGATHDGVTTMIFVTEDFNKTSHVKVEANETHHSDAIKILKLNMTSEFITGIYKYAMMTSVFSGVNYKEYPHSLKVTSGSQDWCGQTFMQANYKGNRYEFQHFSYFGNEGDKNYSIISTWLEDELWTKIRLAPNTLPTGKITLVPSAFFIRLSHQENKSYEATASLSQVDDHYSYTVNYPELERTLEIHFQNAFPYRILNWKETYGKEVTTCKLLNTIMSDYWNFNQPKDEVMRSELKLN